MKLNYYLSSKLRNCLRFVGSKSLVWKTFFDSSQTKQTNEAEKGWKRFVWMRQGRLAHPVNSSPVLQQKLQKTKIARHISAQMSWCYDGSCVERKPKPKFWREEWKLNFQYHQSISRNLVPPIAEHDQGRRELLNVEHKNDADELDKKDHGRGVSEGW